MNLHCAIFSARFYPVSHKKLFGKAPAEAKLHYIKALCYMHYISLRLFVTCKKLFVKALRYMHYNFDRGAKLPTPISTKVYNAPFLPEFGA